MAALLHAFLIVSVVSAALALVAVAVNLALTPRLSKGRAPAGRTPQVSVLVPARNEERGIGAGVGSLLAQDYPELEVVVVNDRSTDGTGAILREMAVRDRRLVVIDGEDPPAGWLGKPHALWTASRRATGELLLFVDADVRYESSTVSRAVAFLQETGADFLCLLPRIEARGFWENVLMPYVLVSFFVGPGWLALTDRPRWLAAGGGAGNLIRREIYAAIGGHAALRDSVIDDVRLALVVKRAGHRARVVRADDRIAVRMYRGFREIWNGFTKNIAYVFNGGVGAFLLFLTAVTFVTSVLPPAVLAFRAAGAAVSSSDVLLAAFAFGLAVAARAILAASLRDPLWPAITNPVMSAVWTALIARSLFRRLVRRRLEWRGRVFDARGARF